VEVLPDGQVGKVTVLQGAEQPRLVEAAIRSLDGFVFAPAIEGGRPVRDVINLPPYRFHLEGRRR
jgi:hypothetical protein